MRNLLIILASFFALLGITFTIFPMGTIAILPIALSFILGFLAIKKSTENQKKFPKLILYISALTLLVVIGKEVFIKDEVVVDQQFDQKKVESKENAKKDLEDLENSEDLE